MEPLKFWTKLIQQQTDIRLRVSQTGGILMLIFLFISVLLEKAGKSGDWAIIGVLTGLALAFTGWMLRGFKVLRPLVTDTDIVLTVDEIRIGDRTFSVDNIEYLDFLVNSYRGMPGPKVRWRRMVLTGVDNTLFFSANGKKYSFGFYLEDEVAMRRLQLLFREFYKRGRRFRERNRGGRTFLMKQVFDRHDFERAKSMEGYL